MPACALVVSGATLLAAPAQAQRVRCHETLADRCSRVTVPLDHSGATPGTLRLYVERVRGDRRRRGTIFVLAGGPGQAATALTFPLTILLPPAGVTHDLVAFDQRGTGRSGVLRCRQFERALLEPDADAAEGCARSLGPRRAFYTTRDSVEDLEHVRRAQGVDRISLYGVSYGSKVALAYAMRYPEHVERLVLDSIVEPEGPDPLYRDSFAAVPRVLRRLCARDACRGVTHDIVGDLSAVIGRLREGDLVGSVFDRRGRRRAAALDRFGLFFTLVAGDVDPLLRARLPGALRSALQDDPAPLLRLSVRASRVEEDPEPPRVFSPALFATTTCEESPLPWERTAPPDARRSQAQARVDAEPPVRWAPFDRATALASDVLRLCARWPAAPEAPSLPATPPTARTLLLSGEDDLRTPLESASRLARRLPGATVLRVRRAGHSVVGWPSGCVQRSLARFFRSRAPARRCAAQRLFRVSPPAPRTLRDVAPARGVRGRRGRTLSAVALTLRDLSEDVSSAFDREFPFTEAISFGGLRGGRASIAGDVVFRRFEYVEGVRLSGTPQALRVSGPAAARGRLRLNHRGDLVGRLDGAAVRLRDAEAMLASASTASRSVRAGAAPAGATAFGR